jgi:hypothetical protein
MSTFPIRIPAQDKRAECTHLTLTSQERWEPSSDLLADEEAKSTVCLQVDVSSTESTQGLYSIKSKLACLCDISSVIYEVNHLYEDCCLLQDSYKSVQVCSVVVDRHVNAVATYEPDGLEVISAVLTKEQNIALHPLSLSKRWQIGLDTAKATLKVTTQRGIRTAIAPLHRRYRTNIAQLRYN